MEHGIPLLGDILETEDTALRGSNEETWGAEFSTLEEESSRICMKNLQKMLRKT